MRSRAGVYRRTWLNLATHKAIRAMRCVARRRRRSYSASPSATVAAAPRHSAKVTPSIRARQALPEIGSHRVGSISQQCDRTAYVLRAAAGPSTQVVTQHLRGVVLVKDRRDGVMPVAEEPAEFGDVVTRRSIALGRGQNGVPVGRPGSYGVSPT